MLTLQGMTKRELKAICKSHDDGDCTECCAYNMRSGINCFIKVDGCCYLPEDYPAGILDEPVDMLA